MEKISITKETWVRFVQTNSDSSYSMLVCYGILILLESDVKTKEEAMDVLLANNLSMSGAQADMAINWALSYSIEGLPNPEMAKIRQDALKGND